MEGLELEIAEWRSFVAQGQALDDHAVEELETHLRDQIADLSAAGLNDDEAFLIAVKRMGRLDALSREFAREHSGRLWRQLVLSGDDEERVVARRWPEALLFAVAAASTVQIARLVAGFPDEVPSWLLRNASLLVIPFVAGWFARQRQLPPRSLLPAAAALLVAAVVVNVYPYHEDAATEYLVAAHLPIVLWFVVAYLYMGGAVRSHERRMDFVRFTGEWCIYYALIGLGGGVLVALTAAILEPTGINPKGVTTSLLPSGAAGAAVVVAWLVESKQRIIENMAPVLTTLFTPLFAVMLTVAAVAYAVTAAGDVFNRELVGVFDALMVVVIGLVLYGISARPLAKEPGWMDRLQVVVVVSALVLDVMVLASMAVRIGDLGLTPNRVAALGLNLVLLVNLGVTAWLSARFLAGHIPFHRLERWQTTYLPVFAVWAAAVVFVLPPAFGFT
jgi:hypothetical protein